MKAIATIISFFALTLIAMAIDLPQKEGFTWWQIDSLKGALLVPNGWHTKSVDRSDVLGFYITKEEIISESGTFETGLSLNVFKAFQSKRNMKPMDFIDNFKAEVSTKSKVLKEWSKDMGPFKSYGFISEGVVTGFSTTIHHLYIINPQTGTLYYFFFEAPSKHFQEAWVYGEPMMKMLMIDDTI